MVPNVYFNPNFARYTRGIGAATNMNLRGPALNQLAPNLGNVDASKIIKPIPTTSGGLTGGQVAGIATGALSLAQMGMGWKAMGDEADMIDTRAAQAEYDSSGRQVYNLGESTHRANAIKPRGAGFGEVAGGALSGAAAGAGVGMMFSPVGAAIGAGVGALVGTVGSIIGGARRRRKMRAKKRLANRRLKAAKQEYNENILMDNQYRAQMETYNDMLDDTSRIHNLYENR